MKDTLIFGTTPEQIAIQQNCKDHDWHGPCIDSVSRYFKCKSCFAIVRDMEPKDYKLEPGEVIKDGE